MPSGSANDEARILLQGLTSDSHFLQLESLRAPYSVLSPLDHLLDENAWSRLLAYLLDSRSPHGLGLFVFRSLLCRLATRLTAPARNALETIAAKASKVLVQCEWPTRSKKRTDIMMEVVNSDNACIAGIGVENKTWAGGERVNQIRDYQVGISERFPACANALIFLTPEGRLPTTSIDHRCHVLVAHYGDIAAVLASAPIADTDSYILSRSIVIHIENTMLNKAAHNPDAKALVRSLWTDPLHRIAMQWMVQYCPTLETLFEDDILQEAALATLGIEFAWSHPECGEFNYTTADYRLTNKKHDIIVYQFSSDRRRRPAIDTPITLRLMARCKSQESATFARLLRDSRRLPESEGICREWNTWICLWTGATYYLKDLAAEDSEALASLLASAFVRTQNAIANEIHEARSKGLLPHP